MEVRFSGAFVVAPTSDRSNERAPSGPSLPAESLARSSRNRSQRTQKGCALSKKTLIPATVTASTRICVLMGRQHWDSPADGQRCTNRRHAHMTLGKVAELMREGKMEMVGGEYTDERGMKHPTWIPVARFVNARRWAPRMSAKMMVLQLVAGG